MVLYAAAQLICQGGPPVFPLAALIQTLLLLTTVPAIAPRDTEDSLQSRPDKGPWKISMGPLFLPPLYLWYSLLVS